MIGSKESGDEEFKFPTEIALNQYRYIYLLLVQKIIRTNILNQMVSFYFNLDYEKFKYPDGITYHQGKSFRYIYNDQIQVLELDFD